MLQQITRKLHNQSGLVRAALLLIIPIVILLALILWPAWKKFHWQSQQIACNAALATAKDFLSIDYLMTNGEKTEVEDAVETVTSVMNGWDDLCPDGGTVYLVESGQEAPKYTLICGLHDTDAARRTRLNADYTFSQIEDALRAARKAGEPAPTTVEVSLNGKIYTAQQTDAPVSIYRGTDQTDGYDGTVIYYGVAGAGNFATFANTEEGTPGYFLFADENTMVTWQPRTAWTGPGVEGR